MEKFSSGQLFLHKTFNKIGSGITCRNDPRDRFFGGQGGRRRQVECQRCQDACNCSDEKADQKSLSFKFFGEIFGCHAGLVIGFLQAYDRPDALPRETENGSDTKGNEELFHYNELKMSDWC